jgi:hypothetical protein
VIEAIQCCQRSSQDPALVSALLDALLMPPELRRGWGTSCGIYSARTMGCDIVTRRARLFPGPALRGLALFIITGK